MHKVISRYLLSHSQIKDFFVLKSSQIDKIIKTFEPCFLLMIQLSSQTFNLIKFLLENFKKKMVTDPDYICNKIRTFFKNSLKFSGRFFHFSKLLEELLLNLQP